MDPEDLDKEDLVLYQELLDKEIKRFCIVLDQEIVDQEVMVQKVAHGKFLMKKSWIQRVWIKRC